MPHDPSAFWYYIDTLDLCVCVPCKAGGSSLYNALGYRDRTAAFGARYRRMTPQDSLAVYPCKRRVMAVRDPLERFASLWRNKARDGGAGVPRGVHGMSPAELLCYVERRLNANGHWMPQARLYVEGAELVDYRRFLDYIGVRGPVMNATTRRADDPAMPVAGILRVYADDVALCARCE